MEWFTMIAAAIAHTADRVLCNSLYLCPCLCLDDPQDKDVSINVWDSQYENKIQTGVWVGNELSLTDSILLSNHVTKKSILFSILMKFPTAADPPLAPHFLQLPVLAYFK